jgi:hypothetical protein
METTKFKKGDLVWIWHSVRDNSRKPGIVMDVRPWVLGGSGVQSWRQPYEESSRMSSEITYEPKRSEYLIVSPSGEFQSWFDEKNITDTD